MYSRKESTDSNCNATHFSGQNQLTEEVQDCERRWTDQHNRLVEKFNALTREKNLLKNQNNELINMIRKLEEERDRLKINLKGEKKIGPSPLTLILVLLQISSFILMYSSHSLHTICYAPIMRQIPACFLSVFATS